MSGHLPKSWVTAPVADIATLTKGKKPASTGASDDSRTTPYVTIKVFETGSASDYCDPAGLPLCTEDDILVVWDGARCGLAGTGVAGAIGSTLVKVEVPEVPPRYLRYFLQSQFHTLNSNPRGVGIPHVDPNVFGSLPFPLPPLAEQRRIVEEIEQQFTRLDAAVVALRAAQAKLRRYRASVLNAAVTGRLVPTEAALARAEGRKYEHASVLLERIARERAEQERGKPRRKRPALAPVDTSGLPELPEGWAWTRVQQLSKVSTGATPLRSKREFYENGTVPWITSSALNSPEVRSADRFITGYAVQEYNLTLYPPHTLLMAMYGEGKTRGKCSELLFQTTINQAIAAIVMAESADNCRQYTKIFLSNYYGEIRRLSSGGVQPNLSLGLVNQIAIPLPPLAEQHCIVAEVERRLSVVRQAEAAVETTLKRAERLRQAILKRAFEGRLVPQDPDDEPASVLLERIRTEKAAAERERRRKGRRGGKLKK